MVLGLRRVPRGRRPCVVVHLGVAFPLQAHGRHPDYAFRSSIPRPPMPLSMLHPAPHGAQRKTRGQDGSLFLSCRALSSPTARGFIPAIALAGARGSATISPSKLIPMGRKVILVALTSATLLVPQTQPELEAARAGLSEFQRVCREARDRLWGVSLCGRVLLVDPGNRVTVANMPDPDQKFQESGGLFAGKLPADLLIANTSIQWGGHQWAMVLLPLLMDEFLRLRLLVHESFHRAQPELGLRASDAASGHLEAESGRLWLRLELRALAQALRGPATIEPWGGYPGICVGDSGRACRIHRHCDRAGRGWRNAGEGRARGGRL